MTCVAASDPCVAVCKHVMATLFTTETLSSQKITKLRTCHARCLSLKNNNNNNKDYLYAHTFPLQASSWRLQ